VVPATVANVAPPKHGFIEQLALDRRVHPPKSATEGKDL
jgi:hypothetical protein